MHIDAYIYGQEDLIKGDVTYRNLNKLQTCTYIFDMASDLPSHHRALVLETFEAGFQTKELPTPKPTHGSVFVRVLEVGILSYHREIYNGERHYAFPKPLVGGMSAVARVAAPGLDAVALKPGQLVWFDCVIRGRDNPDALFMTAIHEGSTEGSRKLMSEIWRDGTFAEFANVPLENCIPLDGARLCQELGYSTLDLVYLSYLLVPYGGFKDIGLEPGETVVVCPATGGFGGAGVQVAIAMGARVIAMGRNEKELARLKEYVKKGTPGANIETVKITGNENADSATLRTFGTIDAVLDLSPPVAAKSTHLKSATSVLLREGRVSLMGFSENPIDCWKVIGDNITMKGKLMYEREDMLLFVKMLERGLFAKGKDFVDARSFGLEDWKEPFDVAAEHIGIGKIVAMAP